MIQRHPQVPQASPTTDRRRRSRVRDGAARGRRAVVPLLLAGTAIGLTACGGGSGSTSTAAAAKSPEAGSTRPGAPSAAARTALAACLKREGVTLPTRPGGDGPGDAPPTGTDGARPTRTDGAPPTGTDGAPPPRPDGASTGGGDGSRLPGGGAGGRGPGAGLSADERAKLQAAMKKCGGAGAARGRRGAPGAAPDVDDPAYRKRITAYVACVRKRGFALPDPDFSGKGPIFDPQKVDQADATFRKASAACQKELDPAG